MTGGGRGIGQGIALGLVKSGMRVAVTARSADQLAETVHLAGGGTIAVAADGADPAAVHAMMQEVEQRLGPVDLLVNNAGTAGPLCCREVLPAAALSTWPGGASLPFPACRPT